MSTLAEFSGRWARAADRFHAYRAAHGTGVTAFVSRPEPRTIGSLARGRQLVAGNFLFAGALIEAPELDLWDLSPPHPDYAQEQHGFGWLDDLAADGSLEARDRAQRWTRQWIDRFGKGHGPGWTPDLTGRRLIRWISHAVFLMSGPGSAFSDRFLRSLAQQSLFLSRRWHSSLPGLPRFEALTGLLYAGLSLEGMEAHIAPTLEALEQECDSHIDAQGGIPTRNPEELLEVLTLLTWASMALVEVGHTPSHAHWGAIERIAPTLRALRHTDGGLARFHGGGRGLDGRLDMALANAGVKSRTPSGLAMGYAHLSAGRTSIIIDASAPPQGRASANAHASTLGFELTSGRRPLIVNCGSGASFGPEWRRAGRATPSHSTLLLANCSSSRLGQQGEAREWLEDTPGEVLFDLHRTTEGQSFEAGHDGYRSSHGLTHIRKLDLATDGRTLSGEDTVMTLDDEDRAVFDTSLAQETSAEIPYQIRFHLHPDVNAEVDMGHRAVSMTLKSGEVWVFRTDEGSRIALEPSVYLEKHRLKPRATKQVVLSGAVMQYASRVRWSLAKTQDTPVGVRDLAMEELDLLAIE